MGKIQKALEAIYNDMNELGKITYAEIARRTGISENQVGCLVDGRRRLNEDNLLNIIEAMRITLSDLDNEPVDSNRRRLNMMLDDLLTAGEPYSNAVKFNIESAHVKFLADQAAAKKAG